MFVFSCFFSCCIFQLKTLILDYVFGSHAKEVVHIVQSLQSNKKKQYDSVLDSVTHGCENYGVTNNCH